MFFYYYLDNVKLNNNDNYLIKIVLNNIKTLNACITQSRE